MHIGHQPVVVADAGQAAAVFGAAVERDEFADDIAVADFEARGLVMEFLVLRHGTERGELPDAVVLADPRVAFDDHMRADAGAVADFNIGADDAVGTDADVRADPCAGIDECGGMDHHSLRSAQSNSASATTSPSTLAWPQNRPMRRSMRFCSTSSTSWSPGTTTRLKRALSILTR